MLKWHSSLAVLLGMPMPTTVMAAMQESSLVPATAVALTSCCASEMDKKLWLLVLEPLLARNQYICPGLHCQHQSVKITAKTVIMALFTSST